MPYKVISTTCNYLSATFLADDYDGIALSVYCVLLARNKSIYLHMFIHFLKTTFQFRCEY